MTVPTAASRPPVASRPSVSATTTAFAQDFEAQIAQLKADRVYKRLNHIESPQGPRVRM